jgi:hypothetical protein
MKQEDKNLIAQMERRGWISHGDQTLFSQVHKRFEKLAHLADAPDVSPAGADALLRKSEVAEPAAAQRLKELTAAPRYRLCDEDVARLIANVEMLLERRAKARLRRTYGVRINSHIEASFVDVIDPEGSMFRGVKIENALAMAWHRNLDLVEINPKADPPVCKILDFDKYRHGHGGNDGRATGAPQAGGGGTVGAPSGARLGGPYGGAWTPPKEPQPIDASNGPAPTPYVEGRILEQMAAGYPRAVAYQRVFEQVLADLRIAVEGLHTAKTMLSHLPTLPADAAHAVRTALAAIKTPRL